MSAPGSTRVLITGGGTGIGRAVAEAVLAGGGHVAIAGRREAPLQQLVAQHPGRAVALVADVADAAQRDGLFSRALAALGSLDGFVHSAGVVTHQVPGAITDEALRAQLELNVVAPLRLGEQALTHLAPGGAMVFISSTLALRPLVSSAAYSASKAGQLQVMKALALAGAAKRLRANAVLPGIVDTEMVAGLRLAPGEVEPVGAERALRMKQQRDAMAALHPLGRLGEARDVASMVLQALENPWLTGSELIVDGGLLLRE